MIAKCPILIVDDDVAVGQLVAEVFQRAGYSVAVETSGAGGLARIRSGFRGLVLLDIVMPGMDGWQTLRHLVAEHLVAGNAICVLSGMAPPDDGASGLDAHVMEFIMKPLRLRTLLDVAERASAMLRGPG